MVGCFSCVERGRGNCDSLNKMRFTKGGRREYGKGEGV